MSLTINPSPLITVIQAGPCWCRSGATDGAFDLTRQRVSEPIAGLSHNLLVITERVLAGSRQGVIRTLGSIPDPRMIVATASCPGAESFWADLAGGWIDLSELVTPDARVPDCISGRPEMLLAAVIGTLTQPVERPATAVVG